MTATRRRHMTSAHGGANLLAVCVAAGACAADARPRDSIDELPELRVVEEMRIGSVDDPDAGFSRLYSVDVDRDGNVFALEGMDNQIRVYGPGGELLHRIGRRGEGPGEFVDPPWFGIKGDTLWTYDASAGRITLFDRTGQLLGTGTTHGLRVATRTGWGWLLPRRMLPDGTLLGWFSRISGSRDDPAPDPGQNSAIPIVRFDASGDVLDTIGWTPPPPRMVPPVGYETDPRRITIGSRSHSVPMPPSDLPDWLPLDDGYLFVHAPHPDNAESGVFTITRLGLAGDTVYHRELNYRPQPYTEETLNGIAGRPLMVFMNGAPVEGDIDDQVRNRLRAEMDFPSHRQPIDDSRASDDGSVWLRRSLDAGQLAHWIIMRPDGELDGELVLPANVRVLWSHGDTFWASAPDELDVPWLTRYRISR